MRRSLSVGASVVVAVLLSLAAFTPRMWFWHWHDVRNIYFETSRVGPLLAQMHDPVHWDRAGAGGADGSSNWPVRMANAIRWRLLPPLVGRALRLGPTAYLALAWAALAWLLGACVLAVRGDRPGYGLDWLEALSVAVLVSTSAGGFVSTWFMGYFDAGYLLALVVAALTPSTVVLAAACALGPWVDERFLMMLPVVLLIRWGGRSDRRGLVWAVAATLPYVAIRLAAWRAGDASVASQIGMQSGSLEHNWRCLPSGWWEAFRMGWLPVVAGVMAAGSRLRPGGRWLLGLALAGYGGAISYLAWDSTRNAAALLPLLLVGVATPAVRRRLPWLAAANLLLPAAIWVDDRVLPLTSFLWR